MQRSKACRAVLGLNEAMTSRCRSCQEQRRQSSLVSDASGGFVPRCGSRGTAVDLGMRSHHLAAVRARAGAATRRRGAAVRQDGQAAGGRAGVSGQRGRSRPHGR